MENKKVFYKNPGFYLMVAAFVLLILSLSMYAANGATQFNKETISQNVIVFGVTGIVMALLSVAADIVLPRTRLSAFSQYSRFLKYVVWLLLFAAFLELIITEFNFIGNVFVGTDPVDSVFIVNYLVAVIPMLLAAVCALVAGVMQRVAAAKEGLKEDEKVVQ